MRLHGETKTERSRRTLGLPRLAVEALRGILDSQADDRVLAGERWQDTGLVFTTHLGTALDAGNIRKMFKRVCTAAAIGNDWTPRELRTSFVSLMSHYGVSIEEIARLVGHASTRTTEVVYRRELRPVITTGAERSWTRSSGKLAVRSNPKAGKNCTSQSRPRWPDRTHSPRLTGDGHQVDAVEPSRNVAIQRWPPIQIASRAGSTIHSPPADSGALMPNVMASPTKRRLFTLILLLRRLPLVPLATVVSAVTWNCEHWAGCDCDKPHVQRGFTSICGLNLPQSDSGLVKQERSRIMRRLVEHGVPVVLVAAHAAPQGHVTPCPGRARHFLVQGRRCTASTRFSAAYREQENARTGNAQACGQTVEQTSEAHALSCRFQSQDSTRVSADTAFPTATRSIRLNVGARTTVGQISCLPHRHGLFAGPVFPRRGHTCSLGIDYVR